MPKIPLVTERADNLKSPRLKPTASKSAIVWSSTPKILNAANAQIVKAIKLRAKRCSIIWTTSRIKIHASKSLATPKEKLVGNPNGLREIILEPNDTKIMAKIGNNNFNKL